MGSDRQKLESLRSSLEGPRDLRRYTNGVAGLDLHDLVVEFDSPRPLENHVDLLRFPVAMGERRPLSGSKPFATAASAT
jgi:hypothetical protein